MKQTSLPNLIVVEWYTHPLKIGFDLPGDDCLSVNGRKDMFLVDQSSDHTGRWCETSHMSDVNLPLIAEYNTTDQLSDRDLPITASFVAQNVSEPKKVALTPTDKITSSTIVSSHGHLPITSKLSVRCFSNASNAFSGPCRMSS